MLVQIWFCSRLKQVNKEHAEHLEKKKPLLVADVDLVQKQVRVLLAVVVRLYKFLFLRIFSFVFMLKIKAFRLAQLDISVKARFEWRNSVFLWIIERNVVFEIGEVEVQDVLVDGFPEVFAEEMTQLVRQRNRDVHVRCRKIFKNLFLLKLLRSPLLRNPLLQIFFLWRLLCSPLLQRLRRKKHGDRDKESSAPAQHVFRVVLF